VQRAAHNIRGRFVAAARGVLPPDQAAMLPALVLGDTSAVAAETSREFKAAGMTHLTAVSGANVTIVCGGVLMTAALFGPRLAAVFAGLALVAFVIVVQPSASVLRAAVMGAITLLAVVSHRRRQAIPVLSASVIMLMVAAPELAVDVGFALSVSATAALVVIAPVWSRRLVGRGWPKPLADAASVAVAAQLVTAPLVAGISGTFSVVSVVANLAVAAVIPPITVVGTAAAALCPVWPSGAQLLIRFTGPELWWLLRVARFAAGVPAASVGVPSGLLGVVCVAAAGIAAVVSWRWRWVRIAAGVAAVCLLAWGSKQGRLTPQELRALGVAFIGVAAAAEGDAALIRALCEEAGLDVPTARQLPALRQARHHGLRRPARRKVAAGVGVAHYHGDLCFTSGPGDAQGAQSERQSCVHVVGAP